MNGPSATRQQVVLWGLILALWALLVLAFAGQLVFANSVPWTDALSISLRNWLPWAFLSPAVAWLAFRFPLDRTKLVVSGPVHIVACMLALVVCEVVSRPTLPPPNALPRRPQLPLGNEIAPERLRNERELPAGSNTMRWKRPVPAPLDREERNLLPGPNAGPMAPDRQFRDLPPRDPGLRGRELPPGVPPFARRPFMNAFFGRAQFNLPIYWIIVSIVHAFRYQRRYEERERNTAELQARLTEAKLQALRMQLHPHFLFNTLNAISSLVYKDPKAADEVIVNLGELLRAALDTTEQEISLEQELQFLDRYLGIQQVRFGDRLRVDKRIDAAALNARVPTLILQPIVENAIRHGIEPESKPGVISIQAGLADGNLALAVRDNGAGVKSSPQQPEGIGLANTKARLQALYGSTAVVVLNTSSAGGCSVELTLPYHENPRPGS